MKSYVYIVVSVAIVIIGIFLIYQLGSKQETLQNNDELQHLQNTLTQENLQNDVKIQNIHVRPSTIKVGDTFTVNATLVNNSQNPIYEDVSPCRNTVFFDSHVEVDKKQVLCEDILVWKIVDSGKNFTISYPDYSEDFRATTAGTVDATVTFTYSGDHKQDDNRNISKSFSFTIFDK
ncbi:MAG TPA: hypothetical protein VFX64_02670 [Candidatus Nitrosotalea sp.]|nr:hypothetical protein [Candidatus Nitrosotalea sp.]